MSSSLGVAIFLLSQLDGRRSLGALRQLRSPEWLRLIGAGLGFFTNFGVRRRNRGPAAPPLAPAASPRIARACAESVHRDERNVPLPRRRCSRCHSR